jgi:nucleoside phosphorylase
MPWRARRSSLSSEEGSGAAATVSAAFPSGLRDRPPREPIPSEDPSMPPAPDALRIGFLAPMPSELRPLVRAAGLRPARLGGLRVQAGQVGRATVVATTTGIGMQAAMRAAERLLDATTIDHVIVVGIAGGVGPTLAIGDLIVPELVVDAVSEARYAPAPLGALSMRGVLQTSDVLLVSHDDVTRWVSCDVVAVDMETAAIAAVCERRRCRWSVVRAISDRAGETPPEVLTLANADGSPNVLAAARYLLADPRRLPGLMKLARDARRAARAAAEAAVRACALL